MLLPGGSALETDVVIGPRLDYGTVRRSVDLAATLGHRRRSQRLLDAVDLIELGLVRRRWPGGRSRTAGSAAPTWLIAHWSSSASCSAHTFTYGPVHGPPCGF